MRSSGGPGTLSSYSASPSCSSYCRHGGPEETASLEHTRTKGTPGGIFRSHTWFPGIREEEKQKARTFKSMTNSKALYLIHSTYTSFEDVMTVTLAVLVYIQALGFFIRDFPIPTLSDIHLISVIEASSSKSLSSSIHAPTPVSLLFLIFIFNNQSST